MIIRRPEDTKNIEWGNGTSRRIVTEEDCVGFAVAHTTVSAGSRSKLQYRNHIEACLCIAGSGSVVDENGAEHRLQVGDLYLLDKHDRHCLCADEDSDLVLVSVFCPGIPRDAHHILSSSDYSSYE